MTYHTESVVASYPYTFDIDENEMGTVVVFVYDGLQVTESDAHTIQQQLQTLETQKNASYALEDNKIIYKACASITSYKDIEHAEVGIRRNFIEDFIETDEDLHQIVAPYHAHTLKTEFVIE